MNKNNNEPELDTYTLLNPDFHTSDNLLTAKQKGDENHEKNELSTKFE